MIRTTIIAAFITLATQATAHPQVTVHIDEANALPVLIGVGVILVAIAAATLDRVRAR